MPLTIGAYTYGSPILRGHHNNITIGKFCSIAEGCIFDGGFNHNKNFISTYPFDVNMPGCAHLPPNRPVVPDITVGNDVWLGESVLVMAGVTIGDGAVIGFRSIITKDVDPYAVVVGANRVTGYRFSNFQIDALLRIAWWNWPDDKIRENAHLLVSENIDEFIEKNYISNA